jgi:LAO/AO transport system kinase
VQLLKAGIIEIPDAFIVNKCDEAAAQRSYHQVRASLWLARPFDADRLPVHRTSARTGEGIAELAGALLHAIREGERHAIAERTPLFFERWVRDEWGRTGVQFLERELGGAPAHLAVASGFDRAQIGFSALLLEHLRKGTPEVGDDHD